ncbi:MAG: SGNH/GDSL hydrolase family protein, partial [Phycisphaerae bacterium]
MKLIRRQKIWLTIVITANLLLWLIPSDVVEQIARDRHTMLGRYSRNHFSWIVGVAVISLISFYVDWSTGKFYRRRWFQVMAALFFLIPALGVIDYLRRPPESAHYIRDSFVYHRPINTEFTAVFKDKPEAYRTYPDAPPGYGTVACTLNTDKRGFRNQTNFDRYDVVVLGDSFAEGSSVSDEHVWPAHLAAKSGLSVCNLGMSGYDPLHYLESLKEYGLALKPRYVLCLLYEGNDFRSAKSDRKRKSPSFSKRLKKYFKQSPMINTLDSFLIETFGPINCAGPVRGIETLDWLPLAIPKGPNANYYTFGPTQLRDLYINREAFSRDRHWLNPRRQLAEMNKLCKDIGTRFVVVYAPLKAHVMLPIVANRLPADKVRAFTTISYKKDLPEPDVFLANLLARVDARESVVGEWCRRESIPFISLAKALRETAIEGAQVYYTYDQHWTPHGHEVVADAVSRY